MRVMTRTTPKNRTPRYDFSAGPAMLPTDVKESCRVAISEWGEQRLSLLETHHRSDVFLSLVHDTVSLVRELLEVPKQFRILLLPGGASMQFCMVPMNLAAQHKRANYLISGYWSHKAAIAAETWIEKRSYQCIISSEHPLALRCPQPISEHDVDYTFYTENETVEGIAWDTPPATQKTLLVSDMTSSLFGKKIAWERYALIFAGTQKNLATTGLTLVILRDELCNHIEGGKKHFFNYQTHSAASSVYNTPSIVSWFLVHQMLLWTKQQGGVESMSIQAQQRSTQVYHVLEQYDCYHLATHPKYRSFNNIVFSLQDQTLNPLFLQKAAEIGLSGLAGHRSRGDLRISIYNATPNKAVASLVAFIQSFAQTYGR